MLMFLGYEVRVTLQIAAYTAVLRMEDTAKTTSSQAVSETSSLFPRAISRIAGEVAAILRGLLNSSSNSSPLTCMDVDTVTTTSTTTSGIAIKLVIVTVSYLPSLPAKAWAPECKS